MPFTKRFNDPDIAMRTAFSMAEAYFEMAKMHRGLSEDSAAAGDEKESNRLSALARREIDQGRDLLEEAITEFPDNTMRAQADYLLAELQLEFAEDAKGEVAKNRYLSDSLNKFSKIVANYPEVNTPPRPNSRRVWFMKRWVR